MTQAAAATTGQDGSKKDTRQRPALALELRLERALDLVRRYRGAVRFFEERPSLLASRTQGRAARAALRRARKELREAVVRTARLRRAIRLRELRRLASLPPKRAICDVFGGYCAQALDVAWCESRLQPDARNGQYRGLFQMGARERELFGHGPSAYAQSRAAHRYFVFSGRDWSPWSCKPWHGE